MPGKYLDLTGKIIGRITVIKFSRISGRTVYWLCSCSCDPNVLFEKSRDYLKVRKYPSCGCWLNEVRHKKRNSLSYSLDYPLSSCEIKGKKFFFDRDDYDLIKEYKWNIIPKRGYVIAKKDNKTIYLHRIICGCPNDVQVDHIDRNPLNNSRENLRLATSYINAKNKSKTKNEKTSIFIGVYFRKDRGKWVARIKNKGITINLGCFLSEKDAAIAYNKKAEELGFLTRNLIP